MSVSDWSCDETTRQGIMRRIKKIIPKEQLLDFDYDALIFNRLNRIRDEIAGIRDSGKIPFGPIELEILQFFLAHHLNRLNRTAFKAINDLFTDLGYLGYRKHPLRARQRKESLRKRGVSPEELVKRFRVFHVLSPNPVPDNPPISFPGWDITNAVFDLQDTLPVCNPQGEIPLPADVGTQEIEFPPMDNPMTLNGEAEYFSPARDDLLIGFHVSYETDPLLGGQSENDNVHLICSSLPLG